MVKILSIFSHKGGVGKTTFINSIIDSHNLKFKKILLIDLDPQLNLTSDILTDMNDTLENYLSDTKGRDICSKLQEIMMYNNKMKCNPFKILTNSDKEVHLIPGYPDLSPIIGQMSIELINSKHSLNYCHCIKHVINTYTKKYNYDLVIVDLGPDLYTLNCCAIWSSNYMIIPCTCDYYSAFSFELIKNKIFGVGYTRFGSDLKIVGFIPNKVEVNEEGNPREEFIDKINVLREKFNNTLSEFSLNNINNCFIKYSNKYEEENYTCLIDMINEYM